MKASNYGDFLLNIVSPEFKLRGATIFASQTEDKGSTIFRMTKNGIFGDIVLKNDKLGPMLPEELKKILDLLENKLDEQWLKEPKGKGPDPDIHKDNNLEICFYNGLSFTSAMHAFKIANNLLSEGQMDTVIIDGKTIEYNKLSVDFLSEKHYAGTIAYSIKLKETIEPRKDVMS